MRPNSIIIVRVIVALAVMVAMFNSSTVRADGTDPTLAAHGRDIVQLDERIWRLEQSVEQLKKAEEAASEPPPMIALPEPVEPTPVVVAPSYSSCADLPEDVVCESEMPTPVDISGLEDGLTDLWLAFGSMEIICGEDSGLACQSAYTELNAKVTGMEGTITMIQATLTNHEIRLQAVEAEQKWKFGGQIGVSGVMAKGVELDGMGQFTSGYGMVGGMVWESERFGLGLSGDVERVRSAELFGVHASAKARAYRRGGLNVGLGIVAFETTALQDSDGVKRLEFNGSGLEAFVGQSLGASATRIDWALGFTVPVQHGSAYGSYLEPGINGVIVGGELKATFGGQR